MKVVSRRLCARGVPVTQSLDYAVQADLFGVTLMPCGPQLALAERILADGGYANMNSSSSADERMISRWGTPSAAAILTL